MDNKIAFNDSSLIVNLLTIVAVTRRSLEILRVIQLLNREGILHLILLRSLRW